MASMQMTCHACGTVLEVQSEWAGMQISCPQCNTALTVPAMVPQQPGFQQPMNGYQQPMNGYQQPMGGYQQGAYFVEDVNMFTALRKYAQFDGRARRKEYWLFCLFNFLIGLALNVLQMIFLAADVPAIAILISIIGWIVNLGFLIPGIAVAIRRLHDIGKSGWNWLFVLIPLVGPIILLVFFCTDSQPGNNMYGPNPKGY